MEEASMYLGYILGIRNVFGRYFCIVRRAAN